MTAAAFRPRAVSRAVLVAAILGIVVLVGWQLAVRSTLVVPELLIVAAGGVAMLVVYLTDRDYGLAGFLLLGTLTGVALPTGTETRVPVSMAIVGGLTGLWLMGQARRRGPFAPTTVPLIGFLLVAAFSMLWSNAFRPHAVEIWDSFPAVQLGGLAIFVASGVLFLFASNVFRSERSIKAIWVVFIAISVVTVALDYLDLGDLPGGLFPMWAVLFAYGQLLFNQRLGLGERALLGALALALVYRLVVVGITWLIGWIPLLVGILILSYMRSKWLVFAAVLSLLVVGIAGFDHYYEAIAVAEYDESGATRLAAWGRNWEVTQDHLLFGTGPAGYAAYYLSYFPGDAMATHSNYLDLVSQVGLVGAGLLAWFLAVLFYRGWRTQHRLQGRDYLAATSRSLWAGSLAVLVAMALGDWLLPFVYTNGVAGFNHALYTWLMFGVMAGLGALVDRRERAAASGAGKGAR